MTEPVNVFVSYSHNDEELKDQLLEHLAALRHEGLVKIWHDRNIDAGDFWVNEIDNQLEVSAVVLLLVTPSFLASSYCYSIELKRALDLAARGKTKLIPIILRPTDWQTTDFGSLQALPKGGTPVTTWENTDEAFLQVAKGVRLAINSISTGSDFSGQTIVESANLSPDFRFYLYVSQSKVDMLYPQIPSEFKLKMVRCLGLAEEGGDLDLFQRLEVVNRFLRNRFDIGTIDEPGEYFAGDETVSWGFTHGSFPTAKRASPFVFFTSDSGSTTLLMPGSTKHLVGDHSPIERGFSSSSIPHVIETLISSIDPESVRLDSLEINGLIAPHKRSELPEKGEELVFKLVEDASSHLSCTRQKLDFLAKTMAHGPSPRFKGRKCLLASPLYVALSM